MIKQNLELVIMNSLENYSRNAAHFNFIFIVL